MRQRRVQIAVRSGGVAGGEGDPTGAGQGTPALERVVQLGGEALGPRKRLGGVVGALPTEVGLAEVVHGGQLNEAVTDTACIVDSDEVLLDRLLGAAEGDGPEPEVGTVVSLTCPALRPGCWLMPSANAAEEPRFLEILVAGLDRRSNWCTV